MADFSKIVDGLYQIHGRVNVFVLDDGEHGVTVIDAGMPRSVNKIVDTVKAIGRTVGDVKHILITHADIDHVGSLGPLAEVTKATVIAGEQSKPFIESRDSPPHLPFFLQPIMFVLNKLMLGKVQVGQVVKDGEMLPIADGIRVLAIPGHTPGNIGFFWERHKVLFIPDLVWMSDDKLELMPPMAMWNMQIAKDSIKQVMKYQPHYICVGHGRFIDVREEPEQVENLMASIS